MSHLILSSCTDGVRTITLNRPDKRNALSLELIEALRDAVEAAHDDADMRVLVLAGAGPCFCAGMDLRGVVTNVAAMSRMLHTLAETSLRLRALPVPTIAAVQGAAVGGGCGLMVVCDIAISHAEAKLGYPEVDLGLCPAVVAPWLIKKIGAGRARAMLLAGGTISGEAAHAVGLVDTLVDATELDTEVASRAASLSKGGRHALAVTKKWLNTLDESQDAAIAERAAALSAEVIGGDEAQALLSERFGE